MCKNDIEKEITKLITGYITDELLSKDMVIVDDEVINTIITDAIESFFDEIDNGVLDLIDEVEGLEETEETEELNNIELDKNDDDDFWKNCY